MTRKLKLDIHIFDAFEGDAWGASLPTKLPGRLQIFARRGHSQSVIEIPSTARVDLAMHLLGLTGARVAVNLTWPRPKNEPLTKPCGKCGVSAGKACVSRRDGSVMKGFHRERR